MFVTQIDTISCYVFINCIVPPSQLRDLETELEAEQRRVREAIAGQRKAERFYKELMMQTEDDRKVCVCMCMCVC